VTTVLVDTNVVSYLFRGHSLGGPYLAHIKGRTAAVSFMTVGELYEGAYRANWSPARIAQLEAELRNYVVVPSSHPICVHWGQIRAERRTQPISPDDGWIAATARANGWPLLTHNPRDFAGISDLVVVSEQQP